MDNAINFYPTFNLFQYRRQWSFSKLLAKSYLRLLRARVQKDNLGLMSGVQEESINSSHVNAWLGSISKTADKEAFKYLYDYFAPRLKSFLIGQGTDPQLSEEVVQETMVKVWQKSYQFDEAKASASTWIFTIARNTRVDLLRKINRPEPDFNDPAFSPDPEPLATEVIARNQDVEKLNNMLFNLPIEQREVLNLAYFEDKAHAEIASQLNLPLGTVKSRIRLALKRIRDTLGDIK